MIHVELNWPIVTISVFSVKINFRVEISYRISFFQKKSCGGKIFSKFEAIFILVFCPRIRRVFDKF